MTTTGQILKIASGLMVLAAAGVAGYSVYHAQKKEAVVVATHKLEPYVKIQAQDVKVKYEPIAAVQADAFRSVSDVIGHMTTMGVLTDSQIRAGMLNTATSLQALVNATTKPGAVTFSITYKDNSIDGMVPPGSYVDLVTQGPNNTTLHADHVLVMENTGYEVNSPNKNSGSYMLVMTLPENVYLTMAQNISTSNVQVVMVAQTNTTRTAMTGTSEYSSTQPISRTVNGTGGTGQ